MLGCESRETRLSAPNAAFSGMESEAGCTVVKNSAVRMLVSDRQTFLALRRSKVDHFVGKLSAVNDPTRPTQPSILSGSVNEQ